MVFPLSCCTWRSNGDHLIALPTHSWVKMLYLIDWLCRIGGERRAGSLWKESIRVTEQTGTSCFCCVDAAVSLQIEQYFGCWYKIADLHCLPALFPTIYIISSAVERYNPQENRWHTIAPMGTRRKHLGCAVYQDMIYAVGGRDDTTELSSAERYNPRTNQWSPVVAMTSRRSGVSLAWFACLYYLSSHGESRG